MDCFKRIVYTSEYLHTFNHCKFPPSELERLFTNTCLKHLRPRKRGRRGGVATRLRRRIFKLPLPSIVLGNAQSLRNKVDELETCARYLHQYRDSNLLCFTETWFSGIDSDPSLTGFSIVRLDRSRKDTGKKRGGGVCICINDRWCTNVTVKDEHCCQDIELLSVALRPFYLPREFQRVFVTVVYIHPKADVKVAAEKIREVVQKQESTCPDSIRLILGDFNGCRLSKVLPNYNQYVACKTCGTNTLDLCYGNIPKAYKSVPMPSLGRSLHNLVRLLPIYKARLKSQKPKKRVVRRWSLEASLALNACFDCTDWEVIMESSETIDEAVDVVNEYIKFCTDMLVPMREVTVYPNSKPWINKEIAGLLKDRQKLFYQGDRDGVKAKQKEIRQEISESKERYRKKVEDAFGRGSSRRLWEGVNAMTGYKPTKKPIKAEDTQILANDLNTFYARFDQHDFAAEHEAALEEVRETGGKPVVVTEEEVRMQFMGLNSRSAAGPDNITGMVVKQCCDSLAPVFARLFQWSLDSGQVPVIWKTATVVPVQKKPNAAALNDYRPVALTSIPFKCLERIVLRRLKEETKAHQDPLQFAYSANRSCEDAINTLLHRSYQHLEKPKSYVRMLFLDFSSAFNTIQPHLMVSKLLKMYVNPTLIQWIFSFLTNRLQRVKISGSAEVWSDFTQTNTGAPQGCVLSPALFTLYTADCRCHRENVLQVKFSDDTSVSGFLTTDEADYRAAVADMVQWCQENFLLLNVSKTKELIVDFRRSPPPLEPLLINGEQVEVVQQYKYLGTILDSKLDWTENTTLLVKKGNQRLHFLRKLRSFGVQSSILMMFYQATVESIITYNSGCCFGNLKVADASRLRKIVKSANSVIGSEVTDLQTHHDRKVLKRIRSILEDPMHPLHQDLVPLKPTREASNRLRSVRTRTHRLHQSFLPTAVRLYNKNL